MSVVSVTNIRYGQTIHSRQGRPKALQPSDDYDLDNDKAIIRELGKYLLVLLLHATQILNFDQDDDDDDDDDDDGGVTLLLLMIMMIFMMR